MLIEIVYLQKSHRRRPKGAPAEPSARKFAYGITEGGAERSPRFEFAAAIGKSKTWTVAVCITSTYAFVHYHDQHLQYTRKIWLTSSSLYRRCPRLHASTMVESCGITQRKWARKVGSEANNERGTIFVRSLFDPPPPLSWFLKSDPRSCLSP